MDYDQRLFVSCGESPLEIEGGVMMACRNQLILLLCVSIVTSHVHAGPQPATRSAPSCHVDIALTPAGGLSGRYIDVQGHPIGGAHAILARGDQVLASTTTDENGAYHFPTATTGIYRVTIDGCSQMVRAWDVSIRPPAALEQLTMVRPERLVRGQGGSGGELGALVGAAALSAAAIAFGISIAVAESRADDRESVDSQDLVRVSSP